MFFAATFTVADTIDWTTLFLSKHQDIQEKAFSEVNNLLKGGTPQMVHICFVFYLYQFLVFKSHQPDLPYLDGICKEIFRLRPATPLSLIHVAEKDCQIAGYHIKHGTLMISNGKIENEEMRKNLLFCLQYWQLEIQKSIIKTHPNSTQQGGSWKTVLTHQAKVLLIRKTY